MSSEAEVGAAALVSEAPGAERLRVDDPGVAGPRVEGAGADPSATSDISTLADELEDDMISPDMYIGSHVVALGLTRADLNGRLSHVCGSKSALQRYEVQLPGANGPMLLRPRSLREISHPALVQCPLCVDGDFTTIILQFLAFGITINWLRLFAAILEFRSQECPLLPPRNRN